MLPDIKFVKLSIHKDAIHWQKQDILALHTCIELMVNILVDGLMIQWDSINAVTDGSKLIGCINRVAALMV